MSDSKKMDRYPGLRSFNENEEMLFFGRKREVFECCNLIFAHQVTVLFSKSGIGKSSLLNAGVFPMLRKSGYYPIKVRFQHTKEHTAKSSPLAILTELLKRDENITQTEVLFDRKAPRLWELCRSVKTLNNQVPVLVFDQFEEFFYYPFEQREQFLVELAEVVHEQPPNRILEQLGNISIDERTDEQLDWVTQPVFKVVFAIRSDKVYELESIRNYIPLIFRNRYQLRPLDVERAREAIVEPAQTDTKESLAFQSTKFTFDPDVLSEMLRKLAERKTTGLSAIDGMPGQEIMEIESSQLQIVCSYIEELVKNIAIGKKAITRTSRRGDSTPDIRIDKRLFDPRKDIALILDGFYKKQLSSVEDTAERSKARNVLEEHLISGGNRTSLTSNQMGRLLDQQTVNKLLGLRLIKEEYTHLGLTYELSHDTLVEPILRAYSLRKTGTDQRKAEARKIEAERELKEAEMKSRIMEKMKEEAVAAWREANRRRRIMLLLMCCTGALFVITLALMIRSFQMKGALNEQLVERVIDIGDKYYKDNNHAMAFSVWDELLKGDKTIKGVDSVTQILQSAFFFDISGGTGLRGFDRNRYAVTHSDHSLDLWSVESAEKPDIRLDTVIKECFGVTGSAIGPYVVYWNAKGGMRIYDVVRKQAHDLPEARIAINNPDSANGAFSPSPPGFRKRENDNAKFLSKSNIFSYADTVGTLKFFDCERWVELPFFITKDKRKKGEHEAKIISLANDGFVGIKLPDSLFKLWDIRNPTGNVVAMRTEDIYDVVNVPGADVVIAVKAGNYKKRLYLYPSNSLMNPVVYSCGNNPGITFSDDGGRLFFYDDNNALRVYNLKMHKEDTVLRDVWSEGEMRRRYLRSSRDGAVLIYNDRQDRLILCDIVRSRSTLLPEKDFFPIYALSPDGQYLQQISDSGLMEMVEPFSGDTILADTVYSEVGNRLELMGAQAAFSNDGRIMAYWRKAGDEKYFVTYDVQRRKKLLDTKSMNGDLVRLRDNYCEWRTNDYQTGIILLNGQQRNIAYYRKLYPKLPESELRKYRPQKGILNFW